jgi:membrane-associated protease RseP (regulator of RpoE activity)
MGSFPSQAPGIPAGEPPSPFDSPAWPPLDVPFWRREPRARYIVLFGLTVVTTTWAGIGHFLAYKSGFTAAVIDEPLWRLALDGLMFSVPVLAILGAHEFGHYFACVYYRVNASLPYFLPFPLPLTGTLGAVIRIRQAIPGKRALFDIGIAGPLAGFVVAVPLLLVGMMLSKVVPLPPTFAEGVIELGEPLLFKMFAWLTFGSIGDGYTIVMHPVAFAAWFGLLATTLNLFPVGQLDGGHIAYAVFGPKSTIVTMATLASLIGLTFVSLSWVLWAVMVGAMVVVLGPRHPRVFDEHVPLDRTRMILAAVAVIVFVLCFSPAPIEPLDLVGTRG